MTAGLLLNGMDLKLVQVLYKSMHILQKPFFNERENGMYKEGQKINVDYSVGQIINIGYYGGTHSRTLIKTQAEVTKISSETWLIYIRIKLSYGAYRTMFGYESEMKELENNYNLPLE